MIVVTHIDIGKDLDVLKQVLSCLLAMQFLPYPHLLEDESASIVLDIKGFHTKLHVLQICQEKQPISFNTCVITQAECDRVAYNLDLSCLDRWDALFIVPIKFYRYRDRSCLLYRARLTVHLEVFVLCQLLSCRLLLFGLFQALLTVPS